MHLDPENMKDIVCGHYTAAEIVETLDLTSEELYDILLDSIMDNLEAFDLAFQYLERFQCDETFTEENREETQHISDSFDESFI